MINEVKDSNDLSFLFVDEEDKSLKQLKVYQVLNVLLNVPSTIEATFNDKVRPAVDEDDFVISPNAKIMSVTVSDRQPVVYLQVLIESGTDYTVIVGSHVYSSIGSTMDEENNTASFKLV